MKIVKKMFIVLLLCLLSCTNRNMFDDWRGIREKEFDEAVLGVRDKYDDTEIDSNLDIDKLLSNTPVPPMGNGDLISFSITEDVALKDVFIELGRLANVDIQLDPKINKGIIFKATDKPLNLIVDKICDLAGLKYSYKDNILKIERDLPYHVNYDVDILIHHQLWSTIETSIRYILDIFPVKKQDPIVMEDGTTITDDEEFTQGISINKEAGIITVYANSKAQKAIKEYIEQAKKNYSTQVLIEAKVVEVALKDEFSAGINWTLTHSGDSFKYKPVPTSGDDTEASSSITTFAFDMSKNKFNLNLLANMLSEFGRTKTLSSPRISALNNQKATLDFTNALIYFSIEAETTTDSTGKEKTEQTATKQEDEEGVKLEITPVINPKTKEVTLTVIPELRTSTGTVTDPTNESNKVPIIQKRKLETSLKIKSGDVMAIGGLMSEKIITNRRGIPFLKDIPILGLMFGYTSKSKELTEVVIFIKATVIDDSNSISRKDKKFYKTMVE